MIDWRSCNQNLADIRQLSVSQDQFCIASNSGDLCSGDRGAGFVINNDQGTPVLLGVNSFGIGCRSTLNGKQVPSIFGDVR